MLRNKYIISFLLIIVIILSAWAINYFQSTPEKVVEKTFKELKRGNLVYGLEERDASKIFDLLLAPNEYNLPNIELHTKQEYRLDPHIVQHTFITVRPHHEIKDSLVSVAVTFSFDEYNKGEIMRNQNYILEKSYQGVISFLMEKESWNKWKITGVKTTGFTEFNEGSWSGYFQ